MICAAWAWSAACGDFLSRARLKEATLSTRLPHVRTFLLASLFSLFLSGCSLFQTNNSSGPAVVEISANPSSIAVGASSTLTVTSAFATKITLTGSDGSTYSLSQFGGTQNVTPSATTTYTATATGTNGTVTASTTVTVGTGTGGG